MSTKIVKLILNQQQLELLDSTIRQGVASDRPALARLALREFSGGHGPSVEVSTKQNG